jgi:hypothetical protein
MSKFAGLALETEKPFRVLLRRPDDGAPVRDMQGVQAYIDVLSLDSRKANELERKAIDKRLSGEKATAEALEEAGDERLAALTVGWYLVGLNRAPLELPFSTANALEMYADPACDWIREQVAVGAGMRKNFTPAPPKDLEPSHGTSRGKASSEPKPKEQQPS